MDKECGMLHTMQSIAKTHILAERKALEIFYKADIAVIFSAVCNLQSWGIDLPSERDSIKTLSMCAFFLSVSGPLDHIMSAYCHL